jgi:hypothetical protein
MAGKPQKYGTQFKNNEDGEIVSFPIENPEIVDDLRMDFGLETLAERTKTRRGHCLPLTFTSKQ